MTQRQAIDKIRAASDFSYTGAKAVVNALVALGMLKLDDEPSRASSSASSSKD